MEYPSFTTNKKSPEKFRGFVTMVTKNKRLITVDNQAINNGGYLCVMLHL